ncbi:MAG: zinc ribbon domain-containing protein [Deltaproteobacteria bacterium]|nr:zinc ribbon domain-containing protein [Deltaproteobacteria bacterium]
MKWIVIRLAIWGIILVLSIFTALEFDDDVIGFYFLLGANTAYVMFLQVKRFADLFYRDHRPFIRRIFNLAALEHIFWTFVVFLTILLFFGFPYIDSILFDSGIDLLNIFPPLERYKLIAIVFLLSVNTVYMLFLLTRIIVRIIRSIARHDKQELPGHAAEADFPLENKPLQCLSCAAELEPEDRFCPMCGSKISSSVIGGKAT